MERAAVKSSGSYLPSKILTNADLEKMVDTSDEWITTRTGIKERRIAGKEEAASDLGAKASLVALQRAGIKPEEIDLIIAATVTPDMLFPSTACLIQEKIGAEKAAAFDISAACSGFIYGLVVADGLIKTGLYQNILLVATEVMSRVADYQDRSTCVLLGDGAGAVILNSSKDEGFLGSYLASAGKYGNLLFTPAGGSKLPSSHKTIDERLHYMKMNGRPLFKVAISSMTEAAEKVLHSLNLRKKDISLVIPHQANLRIIQAVSKSLSIPLDKFWINVERYGNMSSASVAVGFDEAFSSGQFKKGDLILLLAFGAGLTWGSAIIKL